MTVRRIHQNSKLLIIDPYVVRLKHSDGHIGLDYSAFRKTLKLAKEMCLKTWAYSNPEYEERALSKEEANTLGLFAGMNWHTELASYWAFTDREDALQFRLTLGESAKQVHIWPSNIAYTIFEMEE